MRYYFLLLFLCLSVKATCQTGLIDVADTGKFDPNSPHMYYDLGETMHFFRHRLTDTISTDTAYGLVSFYVKGCTELYCLAGYIVHKEVEYRNDSIHGYFTVQVHVFDYTPRCIKTSLYYTPIGKDLDPEKNYTFIPNQLLQ